MAGQNYSVHNQSWVKWEQKYLVSDEVNYVLQINGKNRAEVLFDKSKLKDTIEKEALENIRIKELLTGLTIRKIIFVPNKLINIVAN